MQTIDLLHSLLFLPGCPRRITLAKFSRTDAYSKDWQSAERCVQPSVEVQPVLTSKCLPPSDAEFPLVRQLGWAVPLPCTFCYLQSSFKVRHQASWPLLW